MHGQNQIKKSLESGLHIGTHHDIHTILNTCHTARELQFCQIDLP